MEDEMKFKMCNNKYVFYSLFNQASFFIFFYFQFHGESHHKLLLIY